jgi:hypothetical protein
MVIKKTVVILLTQNQKLYATLQAALSGMTVIKAENIEAVNNAAKHNDVGAVVLHVTNYSGWIIFEVLKTGYAEIPRFAVLAPSLSGDDDTHRALATKYGAAAIMGEKDGIKPLANLIERELAKNNSTESTSKEIFMKIYGDIARELTRLQNDFTAMGMRTLPQPDIGDDTLERLKTALAGLQDITIKP